MQMIGIGLPELMVILVLAALVIGPDRIPQVAADLATWIRRMRAYATHLQRDFNDVMGDLEKEVGTSRDDWREIASVVTRNTSDISRDLSKVAAQFDLSGDLEKAKTMLETAQAAPATPPAPANVVSIDPVRNGSEPTPAPETDAEAKRAEEQPWYVPERATRRRSE